MIVRQVDWRERALLAEEQCAEHLRDIARLGEILRRTHRRMALLEQGLGAEMARAHEAEDKLARRGV